VFSSNIQVHDSYVYDTCAQKDEIEGREGQEKEGNRMWEKVDGSFTTFDVKDLTEAEWEPKEPPRVDFTWD